MRIQSHTRLLANKEFIFRFTILDGGREGHVTFQCEASNLKSAWSKIIREHSGLLQATKRIEHIG